MSVPLKHHYLPVFYLNRWTGEDGQLCQFSRPYKKVISHRRHPEQTGYAKRLYELKGLPPEDAQKIEQGFMGYVDTQAAEALRMLENDDPRITRESEPRSAWSRFIMSLMMRMPEDVAALKNGIIEEYAHSIPEIGKKYAAIKGDADPETLSEYLSRRDPDDIDRWAMSLAPQLMDHRMIGDLLNNMRWFVVRITSEAGEFLTSDRPVITTSTLKEPNAYLFLPIGPKTLFTAVNDPETQRIIEQRDPAERISVMNQMIAGRAIKYVYARDDSQLDFVRQHMGTRQMRTLIERLVDFRRNQRK